jgi:hypothetical protein
MPGHECYHCKQWIEEGEPHDCWTTTEAALTKGLSDDLQDAWERLRETAAEFGPQRIYASHNSIMFSREKCYFFVRPRRTFLEVVIFLGRAVIAPQIRRAIPSSKTKVANFMQIRHRDQVEAPVTDWLREAYELPDRLKAAPAEPTKKAKPKPAKKAKLSPTSKKRAKTKPAAKKAVKKVVKKTAAPRATPRGHSTPARGVAAGVRRGRGGRSRG